MCKSNYTELVEKYQQDANRTDILHTEYIYGKETTPQRAVVGKLVAHELSRNVPTNEQTRKEPANGQKYLTGNEVEYIEKRLAEELQTIETAKRKRTERTYYAANECHRQGSALATHFAFLVEKRRTDLMQGYK